MKLGYILPLVILITLPIAQAWEVNISIVFENNRMFNLSFGMENGTTDRFDTGKDIPLPPPPPNADFDAYFKCKDSLVNRLQKDIRNYRLWELIIKTKKPIGLRWDKPPIPLRMNISGRYINMNTISSIELAPGDYDIIITGYKNTTTTISTPITTVSPTPTSTIFTVTPAVTTTIAMITETEPTVTVTTVTSIKPTESSSPQVVTTRTPGFDALIVIFALIMMSWTFKKLR